MANKLIDLAGLGYFFDKLKKKYLSPALLNGDLYFEYLTTTYWYTTTRPDGADGSYDGKPTEPQGVVYLGDNSIAMGLCAARNGASGPRLTDETAFQIFTGVNKPQYAALAADRRVTNLGHANSMSYDPVSKLLYVAVGTYSTASGSTITNKNSKKIEVIQVSGRGASIHMDRQASSVIEVNTSQLETQIGKTIDSVEFVSFDKVNRKLYIWVGHHYLAEVNMTTKVASYVAKIEEPQKIGGGQQGFAVMGDLVFLVKHFPNQIWVYSISQNKIVRCFNIPDYDCFGHRISYVEDIDYDVDTGNFYIATFTVNNYFKRNAGQCRRACYTYRFNPFTDRPGAWNAFGYMSNGTEVTTNYYNSEANSKVGISVIPANSSPIHQRGDDYYPFGTIQEAITALQSGKFPHAYHISLLADNLNKRDFWEYLTIRNIKTFFNQPFSCLGMDIQNCDIRFVGAVEVKGTFVTNAPPMFIADSKVYFNGYDITVPSDWDVGTADDYKACLRAAYSIVDCNSDATYHYNGGSFTSFDILLNRSTFKSQASGNTDSTTKKVRVLNSEWGVGYPPSAYSLDLRGSNKGQFTANKILAINDNKPTGNVQAVVMIKYNSAEHFFTSGVRYKGTVSLNLFTNTPHGVVKTVLNADGTVDSTTFEGTQPSAVTEFDTKFIRYV